MSNKFKYLVTLLILIIPALYLMVNHPLYPSIDGLLHIERIDNFHQAFTSGQIPVRIAPSMLEGIGFPMLVVNYHLPYYLAEIFMFITNNPIVAFKTVIALSYILSAIFTFLLFSEIGSSLASLTGAMVFSYLPYRFANIYTRGAIGESTALMFVPLILLSLHKINRDSKWAQLLLIISVFGLITSHTLIFILFGPFFISYLFVFLKPNRKFLTRVTFATFWGIALSSFQIIPIIFEKKYTKFAQLFLNAYTKQFLSIPQTLRLPLPNTNFGTPYQAGISSLIISILSLIALIFKRNKYIIFFLTFIIISIFLTSQYSRPIWEHTSIKYLTYPWRLLSLTLLSVAFLSVYLVDNVKYKKLLAALIIITTVVTSRHYFLKPTQYESTPTEQDRTSLNEFDTVWSTPTTKTFKPFITSSEKISISNLKNQGINFSYEITTLQPSTIIVRRLYFPGWHIQLDNKDQQIIIKDGLISINVPPGTHKVFAYFEEDFIRRSADLLTLLSLAIIIFIYVRPNLKK